MIDRAERRPLAACGHVAPPEIGNAGDACGLYDLVRITDLQRERMGGGGPVSNRLSVTANGCDGFRVYALVV